MSIEKRDVTRAVEWARKLLKDDRAIILDTETTGLGHRGEIVEIAIIDTVGQPLLDTLVKPTIPIPAEATAIHGIGDGDVASAPAWPEVAPAVFSCLRNASQIAIYNAAYDRRLIYQSCVASGMTEPYDRGGWPLPENGLDRKISCAMQWYAMWYGDWNDYHGSYRWQKLDGGHRALGDCLATLDYIKRMANDERV